MKPLQNCYLRYLSDKFHVFNHNMHTPFHSTAHIVNIYQLHLNLVGQFKSNVFYNRNNLQYIPIWQSRQYDTNTTFQIYFKTAVEIIIPAQSVKSKPHFSATALANPHFLIRQLLTYSINVGRFVSKSENG